MKQLVILITILFFPLSNFATIIYVNPDASIGQNTGANWENAFLDLHIAFTTAVSGDSIWISSGTYYPTETDNRSIHFSIPEGVRLFGGFIGTESNIAERDIEDNPTILSGNIGNVEEDTDNSYTIASLLLTGEGTTIIDGINFEDGMAVPGDNGSVNCNNPLECQGGGLHILSESISLVPKFIIRKSGFLRNKAAEGGGLFLSGISGLVDAEIRECVFENNESTQLLPFYVSYSYGGGAYIIQEANETFSQSVDVIGCKFHNNSSQNHGGGIFIQNSDNFGDDLFYPSLKIKSSEFSNNFSGGLEGGLGGGIFLNAYSKDSDDLLIENCSFYNNSTEIGSEAGVGGGGHFSFGGEGGTINYCNFFGNMAKNGGGFFSTGNLKCNNTGFHYNEALEGGGIINYGELRLLNCLSTNNFAYLSGGAIWSITLQSNYSNSVFYNNYSIEGGGALSLGGFQTNLTNCIFWRNESELTDYDILEGGGDTVTINNCIFDVNNCGSIALSPVNEFTNCNNSYFNQYPDFRDTAALDFTLSPCSFAINAGAEIPGIFADIETDLAGNPRILDGIPDIGAYEIPGIQAFATITAATGASTADGLILIDSIIGAVSPYEITWSNMTVGNANDNLLPGIYTMTLVDSFDCVYSEDYEITFTSNFENPSEATHLISPNPTSGIFSFSWLNTGNSPWSYQISDIQGRLIRGEELISESILFVDLSSAPAGVYFIKAEREGIIIQEKLLKF